MCRKIPLSLIIGFFICFLLLGRPVDDYAQSPVKTETSIHKLWKWVSFTSNTNAFVNFQKIDLDLRAHDTTILRSYNETIISMYSMVENKLVQKTRNANEPDSSRLLSSKYHITGDTIIIEKLQAKGQIVFRIKELSVNQLVLIVHVKLESENGEQHEADLAMITFKAEEN